MGPEAQPEPAPQAPRQPDAPFLLALAFRLRERGIRVSLADVEAAAALTRTKGDWSREDLSCVLAGVLVRREKDRLPFEETFGRLYDQRPPEGIHAAASRRFHTPIAPPGPQDGGTTRSHGFKIWMGASALWNAGSWAVPAGLCGLAAWLLDGGGGGGGVGRTLTRSTPGLREAVAATAVSLAATIVGLAIWHVWTRGRRDAGTGGGGRPPPPVQGDDTVFRVGSLGGAAPTFLTGQVAADIAELFSYRYGDHDGSLLDISGTVAAHARGGDPATLTYERRRVLPTIHIVTDRTVSARHWHSLAEEFAGALAARGIAHEQFDIPGTFFEWGGGGRKPRPEAIVLEMALENSEWIVTTMFAEAHRLSPADIEFLKVMAEKGPVLFLDQRDSRLWDARHTAIAETGISILPATAVSLRDGLAQIFAPDRARPTRPPSGRPICIAPSASLAQTADFVLGDALLWASECALVQPMSFALAEQLRQRHAALSSADGQLVFSRMAALPGSWVGPEGLRFEPRMRRHLLNVFCARSDVDRAGVMAAFDVAFAEEPSGESASSLWRYARAQVAVYAGDLDDALLTIEDVKQDGLVDSAPIDDFFKRLRPPGANGKGKTEVGASSAIVLPTQPTRAALRRQLSGDTTDLDVIISEWTIGVPETRARYIKSLPAELSFPSGYAIPQTEARDLPEPRTAAFLPGGRYLVADGTFDRNKPGIPTLIDSVTGDIQSLEVPFEGGLTSAILTARDVNDALFALSDGRLVMMRPKPAESSQLSAADQLSAATFVFEPVERGKWSAESAAAVALSPRGDLIAIANGESGLDLIGPGSSVQTLKTRSTVTALTFPQPDYVIAALENGEIVPIVIRDGKLRAADIYAEVEGRPVALVQVQPNQHRGWMIVALDDGRVVLLYAGGSDATNVHSEIRLRWPARRVAAFSNRPAALLKNIAPKGPNPFTGFSMDDGDNSPIGLSIGVLGAAGEFDIVGLTEQRQSTGLSEDRGSASAPVGHAPMQPMSLLDRDIRPRRDRTRALGIAAQSRRIAVLRGNHLEVRPLVFRLDERIVEQSIAD